jgi:uncharacterized protein YukJ
MNINEQTLTSFYRAFAQLDPYTMASRSADGPVFGDLNFSEPITQMCNHIQVQVQTLRFTKHLLNLATLCLQCRCLTAVT